MTSIWEVKQSLNVCSQILFLVSCTTFRHACSQILRKTIQCVDITSWKSIHGTRYGESMKCESCFHFYTTTADCKITVGNMLSNLELCRMNDVTMRSGLILNWKKHAWVEIHAQLQGLNFVPNTSRFLLMGYVHCRSHMTQYCSGYCSCSSTVEGTLQLLHGQYSCHSSCSIPSKYPQQYSNLQ